MNRRIGFLPGLISALMVAIMALSLWLDNRTSSMVPRAPIPASTLAAFRPGDPIENPE